VSLPQLRLDNQLCFLFHRIARELNAAYRPLLADLGLTYSHTSSCCPLERDGPGVVSSVTGSISTPARCHRSCAGWSMPGWYARALDSDERRVTIHLTGRGRDLQERAAASPRRLPDSSWTTRPVTR